MCTNRLKYLKTIIILCLFCDILWHLTFNSHTQWVLDKCFYFWNNSVNKCCLFGEGKQDQWVLRTIVFLINIYITCNLLSYVSLHHIVSKNALSLCLCTCYSCFLEFLDIEACGVCVCLCVELRNMIIWSKRSYFL